MHPMRLLVLLVVSGCFLVTRGRLLVDSERQGLVTDGQLYSPVLMPFGKRESSSRARTAVWRAEEGEDEQSHKLAYYSAGRERNSPATRNIELALPGNVGGSYDYPYYNEDPVVTFDMENPDDESILQRSVGRPFPTFQPLCPFERTTVHLDQKLYRESSYVEINCLHPYRPDSERGDKHNKVCGGAGFGCIQKNRTIILVKRKHNQNCWETEARNINTGCDCMWPKHTLGDILEYHG